MKKKIIYTAILIICVLSFLIYSIGIMTFENVKLKGYTKMLENNVIFLNKALLKYQSGERNIEKREEDALNYIKWRFVLKDQVDEARKRLNARTAEISNMKKDKDSAGLTYYTLGLSCVLASDFDSAIASFEEALKYDPKDSASFYNLGLLYSAYRKNAAKAVEYYKKYLELVPKSAKSDEVRDRIKDLGK